MEGRALRILAGIICLEPRALLGQDSDAMRKSERVELALLVSTALSLTGCQRTEVRNCVNEQGIIVPDSQCDHYGGGYWNHAHYVYGGASGGRYGDRVYGGSGSPAFGARVVGTDGVARGGFGHGGSGGEGE